MTELKHSGRVIRLHKKDNVATALEDLPEGSVISVEDGRLSVTLKDEIQFGHKFSLWNIAEGENIYKYGVTIGRLTSSVKAGAHVHLHNLVTLQKKGDAQ